MNQDWENKKYMKVTLKLPMGRKSFVCYEDGEHYIEPFTQEKIRGHIATGYLGRNCNGIAMIDMMDTNGFYIHLKKSKVQYANIKDFYEYISNKERAEKVIRFMQKEKELYLQKRNQEEQKRQNQEREKTKVKKYYSDKITQFLGN